MKILRYTCVCMTKKETNKTSKMKELLAKEKKIVSLPQPGDIIEGTIIKVSKTEIVVEIDSIGAGVVYGGEIKENRTLVKGLKVGQKISALVIGPENEDGYIELSFKEANLKKIWNDLRETKENNETISVRVIEANRGGLVIEYSGIVGFLPVSQLSPQNYPRVEGGDKNKILKHLNIFVGKEMLVKIITLDKRDEKLIVSEKLAREKELKKNLEKYKEGDIVEGTVTALADFGAFIKFGDNLEGLAHISELAWEIIDHPSQIIKENDKVKAQITNISNSQISLSLKTLKDDPWQKIEDKYQSGRTVNGRTIKSSSAGVFVEIEKGIYGLLPAEASNNVKFDQTYKFKITSLSPEKHKMTLALTEL